MKSLFDKQLLSPVRLHQQPESVVEIVSAAMREELGSVQADQNLRLSVGETARVMQVLDKSTGRIACDSAGQTGFVGVVDHPREGLMVVRGRGKQVGESVKADGRFTSNHGDILFQIQTHKAGLREAEAEYFRLVEGADGRKPPKLLWVLKR